MTVNYIDKIKIEIKDLQRKICKIEEFQQGNIYAVMRKRSKILLIMQRLVMKLYVKILEVRIHVAEN